MKIAKLLSGVALVGLLTTGAQAADLLYSQPAPQMAAYAGGPYFAARAGFNWNDDITVDADGDAVADDVADFDGGFNASLAFGTSFGRWGMLSPRIEAELGYLANDVDTFDDITVAGPVATDGELNANYGLVNLLLDIPLGWGFTPFIGAGAGYANVEANIDLVTGAVGPVVADDTTFAWNVTAGLSYDISRNITLELAYRYLQFTDVEFAGAGPVVEDDVDNHQVNFGVRVAL